MKSFTFLTKFALVALLLGTASVVRADEVTFAFANYAGSSNDSHDGDNPTLSQGVVTLVGETAEQATTTRIWDADGTLRIYKSSTVTISSTGEPITSIVWTANAASKNHLTADGANADGKTLTWTGSAQSVVFTNDGTTSNYTSVTVYLGESSAPTPEAKIYDKKMLNDEAGFVPSNVVLPEDLSYVWYNNQYGWVATGFANNTANAAEAWLVSPKFNVEQGPVILTFDHALNKGTADAIKLAVSTDKQNWTEVVIPNVPDGTSWTFVNSGEIDLTNLGGPSFYVGFHYQSTADNAPTWEIKNFLLKGTGTAEVEENPVELRTITSLKEANESAKEQKEQVMLHTNGVLVQYASGSNIYVTDYTGVGFLLYGSASGVKAGDMLGGQQKGELYTYHGLPELSFSSFTLNVNSSDNAVEIQTVELSDVLAAPLNYTSLLVKFEGVSVTGTALESKSVGITKDGEDAVIYDQFNKLSNVTFDTSAEYSFTAIVAVRDGAVQLYPISAEDFTGGSTPVNPQPGTVYTSITDIKAAATADKVQAGFQMENLLVTYVNGKNIYVSDGRQGFLLYGNNTLDVKAGDRLSGTVTGDLYLYHNLPELAFTEFGAQVVSSGETVSANSMEFPFLIENYQIYTSALVEVRDVTINGTELDNRAVEISKDGTVSTLYDQFSQLTGVTFEQTRTYTFKAIVAVRDDVIQVYPIDKSDFVGEEPPYEFEGQGTEASPYTADDVQHLFDPDQASEYVWLEGTIIGCVNGTFNKFANTEGDENLVASNIIIVGDSYANEAKSRVPSTSKWIPVNLNTTASPIRARLNLVDNIQNVGKKVKLRGHVEKYFSVAGVKNLGEAIIDGDTITDGIEDIIVSESASTEIYTLSGQRVQAPTRGLYIIGGKKVLVK